MNNHRNNTFHIKSNIAVVIPNWNGASLIRECLDSLLAQSSPVDIIVVENGSVDESIEILKTYGNKITVLPQPNNLGFAGGVNVGIKYAIEKNFDYVALLNNDAMAHRNWVEELTATANATSAGIVTCKFLRTDERILDSTGDFYTVYGLPYPRGRNEVDKGQYDKQTTIFGASGGASLYSCKMLNEIGLFDEDFFAYFEDVDISFRAQLAGYTVRYNPKAIAYHRVGATSGKINGFATYQTAKNFWILYAKNMPSFLYWKYLPLAIYWYFRMYSARLVKGGFMAFTKGMLKAIVLMPSTLRKRRTVQKHREVPVSYIDSILVHHKAPKPPTIAKNDKK